LVTAIDGKTFHLAEPFVVSWLWPRVIPDPLPAIATYRRLAIPIGFKTDLASIPQIFRSLIPQLGKHMRAAVAHDFIYSGSVRDWTRAEADRLFLDAMVACKVPGWKRWLMYLGVRVGGWIAWRNARKEKPLQVPS